MQSILNTTPKRTLSITSQGTYSEDVLCELPLGARRFRIAFAEAETNFTAVLGVASLTEESLTDLALACRGSYGVTAAAVSELSLYLTLDSRVSFVPTSGTGVVTEITEGVDCSDSINAVVMLKLNPGTVSKIEGDLTIFVQPAFAGLPVAVTLTTGAELSVSVEVHSVTITQVALSTAQEIADIVNNSLAASALLRVEVSGDAGATQADFSVGLLEASAPGSLTEQSITYTTNLAYASETIDLILSVTGTDSISVSGYEITITQTVATTAQDIITLIQESTEASALISVELVGADIHQTAFTGSIVPVTSTADSYAFRLWGMTDNTWFTKIPADIPDMSYLVDSISFPFSVTNIDRLYVQVNFFNGVGSIDVLIGVSDG